MGGFGSGRRPFNPLAKRTVEQCLHLDLRHWQAAGIITPESESEGFWRWYNRETDETTSIIRYSTRLGRDHGWAWVGYILGPEREQIVTRIAIQTTRPNFGGLRWWFTCPMIRSGRPCGGLVRKLYLDQTYFACRICSRLTYRSCQQAHARERVLRSFRALEMREGLPPPGRATIPQLALMQRAARYLAADPS